MKKTIDLLQEAVNLGFTLEQGIGFIDLCLSYMCDYKKDDLRSEQITIKAYNDILEGLKVYIKWKWLNNVNKVIKSTRFYI